MENEKKKFLSMLLVRRQKFRKTTATGMMLIISLLTSILNNMHYIAILSSSENTKSRSWKRDRSSTFWEHDVPAMDENAFRHNFRVSRKSFMQLCELVKSIEKKNTFFRPSIGLEKRVAIAMYALGSSGEYRPVSNLFGVGLSTVSEIVLEFSDAVCDNLGEYISSYPPTQEEIDRIIKGFEDMGFPQCFGAIDGCHIELQPEKSQAVDYYNYKGWYSNVLLAACDHRCAFTYLNIGSAGRNNDSYIFENSSLKRFHECTDVFTQHMKFISNRNVPVVLIGDSAFRLSRFMMKPFPYKANQPEVEKMFNYRLSRCRRVIENAFGQLKARFRKLGKGLE